jgi:hypothetical protein
MMWETDDGSCTDEVFVTDNDLNDAVLNGDEYSFPHSSADSLPEHLSSPLPYRYMMPILG